MDSPALVGTESRKEAMKRCMNTVTATMLMAAMAFFVGCVKDPTNVNVNENVGYDIPEVETTIVQEITETTAKGGGVVTSFSGGSIIERGLCWGTESNPTVSGNHVDCGTGAGSFSCGLYSLEPNTLYHVRAYAINSVGIGYGADVSFTTLQENGGGGGGGGNTFTLPEGSLNGAFSISSSSKVYFSKGNLQYNKTTQEWSFMEHQYDMVEYQGQNVGENYANQNIVSLFCFGTSGYHNVYPYLTRVIGGYDSEHYDWGEYNRISNGGNQVGIWHTISHYAWDYIINERITPSGIRYAKGRVNNVNGIILLPDDWNSSTYGLHNTNIHNASFDSNVISALQWGVLENAGAVFLPAAGYRTRTTVYYYDSSGSYWSSSHWLSYSNENYGAYVLGFSDNSLNSYIDELGQFDDPPGRSVRLAFYPE